ncbi:MAG: hypothetical protein KKG00_04460 [Bacteroidetes bacterium]|nr:hypothetical protein [Bacteroidota bacterium]
MSKRLVRVFAPQLPARLPHLLAREVNVVLFNGNTYFGYLVSHAEMTLLLRDLRGHEHNFAMSEIAEVIYDQPATLHNTK